MNITRFTPATLQRTQFGNTDVQKTIQQMIKILQDAKPVGQAVDSSLAMVKEKKENGDIEVRPATPLCGMYSKLTFHPDGSVDRYKSFFNYGSPGATGPEISNEQVLPADSIPAEYLV
jgi:hypothetical protein